MTTNEILNQLSIIAIEATDSAEEEIDTTNRFLLEDLANNINSLVEEYQQLLG